MAAPEKRALVRVLDIDDVQDSAETPYALECARLWGGVAIACIFAAVALSFVMDPWARAWGIVAGTVAALAVIAMLGLFADHVAGVAILSESEDDDDE